MSEPGGWDGVLNIYKPRGCTSYQVVDQVKGHIPGTKVGHAGTLDPDATGVLPVCVGRATKIVPYLLKLTKTYVATMRLGTVTDTQDSAGRVIEQTSSVSLRDEELEAALAKFRGETLQTPPMYSAIKREGKRLYALARRGLSVERRARKITVHEMRLLGRSDRDVTFLVTCSSGTYVRTLCHDVGRLLGCGAHLRLLERTRVGSFTVDGAVLLERLRSIVKAGRLGEILIPMYEALDFLPAVEVHKEYVGRVLDGMPISMGFVASASGQIGKGTFVRVRNGEGRLLAVAEAVSREGEEETFCRSRVPLLRLRRVLAI